MPTKRCIILKFLFLIVAHNLLALPIAAADNKNDNKTVRIFIFAGQSNMEGADSRISDIKRYPPFIGLDSPQNKVLFSYSIGRENKMTSNGWVELQSVNNFVGPELSFARKVAQETKAPIAIIKCAAGGTTLGEDWNPENPGGFKLYPIAKQLIMSSLADLDKRKIPYRIEGFMWHQGENDMFNGEFRTNYGNNLKNFIAQWRQDLKMPNLHFYIGELCTKSVWGMDNRFNMYAIRTGQKSVTESDPLATYIPTSHDAMETDDSTGLHYHYGTLGQLEHGVNYADAYLKTINKHAQVKRPLIKWPYKERTPVKLFILAGHRNMEGERAFTQELASLPDGKILLKDNQKIAYKYNVGGGYKISDGWEPLGPAGFYDTFGPELSFAATLQSKIRDNIAIVKFTHSGSQINDWTPEGTQATERNLYPQFIRFIQESIDQLTAKGHHVELTGIFYHLGENDTAFSENRSKAAKWLSAIVKQSRQDLGVPTLKWFISQQPPADEKDLNTIDVTKNIEEAASADRDFIHIKLFNLPPQPDKLVITTAGIVQIGEFLALSYLKN